MMKIIHSKDVVFLKTEISDFVGGGKSEDMSIAMVVCVMKNYRSF